MALVDGIDVYDGNGPVRWGDALAHGLELGVAKATEGTVDQGSTQSTFHAHRAAQRAVGLPYRLSYHFARPDHGSAALEAEHYALAIGALEAGETWAIDLEDLAAVGRPGWPLDPGQTGIYVTELASRMHTATGRRGLLYMNDDFRRHLLGPGAYWDHAELWLAWWNPTPPPVAFTVWQHGVGSTPITDGPTDLDRADPARLDVLTARGGAFLMALTDSEQSTVLSSSEVAAMKATEASERALEVLALLGNLAKAGALQTIDGHLGNVYARVGTEADRVIAAVTAGIASTPGAGPAPDVDKTLLAAALRAAADRLETAPVPAATA